MTREQLQRFTKEELMDLLLGAFKKIGELERRIAQLEKNSSNSSKPPSQDLSSSPVKRTRSLRMASGKKPGGQPGHPGTTRHQVANPDYTKDCSPFQCKKCSGSLDQNKTTLISKRQVADIPPVVPMVTEYRQFGILCTCGHFNKGTYPDKVNAPVQIGEHFKAFLVYLNVVHLIPFKRLAQLCEDLFNFPLSKRTIENSLDKALLQAEPLYKQIMAIIQRSFWVGGDETGKRVEGKRWWEWVWQSVHASYYAISPSRGYQVVKEHFGALWYSRARARAQTVNEFMFKSSVWFEPTPLRTGS